MIKYIILGITLLFSISCKKENKVEMKQEKSVAQNIKTDNFTSPYYNNNYPYDISKSNMPYELTMKTFQLRTDTHSLEIDMLLHQGAFFVSPKSKGDFKGKFRVEFSESKHIELEDGILESPLSKETFDPHPYVNGYVNWVKENTIYIKNFKILTPKENFTVTGVIKFVIEPRCTLEEIPFIIVHEHGELRVRRDGC
ncbi:hypothetical protein [Tenacibaculum jejuense]|uniref:Probable lipoprotein n=1 Tax=Tenacibaculum jejuense TaxID=584609 RepID=A0A238U9G6_9FLAO|nr:hypothetical protein [Tenacibaculum jejuense]SNR15817.1 Probable lipoprotein precursor [Tenacibaculum jejuense]